MSKLSKIVPGVPSPIDPDNYFVRSATHAFDSDVPASDTAGADAGAQADEEEQDYPDYGYPIDWAAVRLVYDSDALKDWAGERSGPIAIYDDEKPRSRWNDILLLAERLAPEPALLPKEPAERALAFGLGHEICGEGGLAWSRRLELIHAGLQNSGGFPERVSKYLAKKYGYSAAAGADDL